MKMSKIVALILVVVMSLSALASCNIGGGNDDGNGNASGEHEYAELNGTYDITMWVSEIDGVDKQFYQQIDAFMAKYPGIVINAEIEGVTESDAGGQVLQDVATAPDIYCFAQDQLARLVQASALATPPSKIEAALREANDAGSIEAASVNGKLYAYPLTADNGFFMFYDQSLFNDEDVESLERIIEICEENNLKLRFPLENGWYNAAFFFATGCSSTWTLADDGVFTKLDDNYNSQAGYVAMKAMEKLAKSDCYDPDNETYIDAAVIISGTWATNNIEEYFGENYAATDLPSFVSEVDGETYHLSSFSGYKLMGVKPSGDTKRDAVLSLLAQFLTGADCQLERFNKFAWGPSNVVAKANDAVQSSTALAAFAKQAAYSKPQGQIHGDWWNIAKALGSQAKNAKNDQEIRDYLGAYENAAQGLVGKK